MLGRPRAIGPRLGVLEKGRYAEKLLWRMVTRVCLDAGYTRWFYGGSPAKRRWIRLDTPSAAYVVYFTDEGRVAKWRRPRGFRQEAP